MEHGTERCYVGALGPEELANLGVSEELPLDMFKFSCPALPGITNVRLVRPQSEQLKWCTMY